MNIWVTQPGYLIIDMWLYIRGDYKTAIICLEHIKTWTVCTATVWMGTMYVCLRISVQTTVFFSFINFKLSELALIIII